jgi:hypothetical protein
VTIYIHPPIDYGRDYNALTARLGGQWSHLATDSCLGELLTFARKIGLKHAWLQGKPGGLWHFDVTPAKFQAAKNAGAVVVDSLEFGRLINAGILLKRGAKEARP